MRKLSAMMVIGLLLLSGQALADVIMGGMDIDQDPDLCSFDLNFPDNMRVYAAGAYRGRRMDIQIDRSGHEATLFNLTVNSPDAPVALMLNAYEPSVWQIGWTEGTVIKAVLVSGYHIQKVNGLMQDVPVIIQDIEHKSPCESFQVHSTISSVQTIEALSKRLFKRSPEAITQLKNGEGVLGDAFSPNQKDLTAKVFRRDDFRLPGTPFAGRRGLDESVQAGLIRPATKVDIKSWQEKRLEKEKQKARAEGVPEYLLKNITLDESSSSSGIFHNPYVILSPDFVIPSGLYGADSATFILSEGLPMPKGEPGHSTIIRMDNGEALGPGFRRISE